MPKCEIKECQCYNDPNDKLRVYCNGCDEEELQYRFITKELLAEEKKQGVKVGDKWVLSLEFSNYKTLLRKCKINSLLSPHKFISW